MSCLTLVLWTEADAGRRIYVPLVTFIAINVVLEIQSHFSLRANVNELVLILSQSATIQL